MAGVLCIQAPSKSRVSRSVNIAYIELIQIFLARQTADGYAYRGIPGKSIASVIEVENNVMNNGGTCRDMYFVDGCSRIEGQRPCKSQKGAKGMGK